MTEHSCAGERRPRSAVLAVLACAAVSGSLAAANDLDDKGPFGTESGTEVLSDEEFRAKCVEYSESADTLAGELLKGPPEPGAAGGLNWFTWNCLLVNKYEDYPTKDLNLQLTAASSDGVVRGVYNHTVRNVYETDQGGKSLVRSRYRKFSLGAFGSNSDPKNVALFDLDKFTLEDGVGGVVGIEFGVHPGVTRKKFNERISDAMDVATRRCLQDQVVERTRWKADEADQAGTEMVFRSQEKLAAACSGEKFYKYLSEEENKAQSWQDIVKPIWGYEEIPRWYGGAEGSYARQKTTFLPLRDTATGDLLPQDMPVDVLGDEFEEDPRTDPYAIAAYVGTGFLSEGVGLPGGVGTLSNAGWSAGLTYRRTFATPSSLRDQTVCAAVPNTDFDQCRDVNVAAPYELEGFVLATALKADLKHLGPVPRVAVTFKQTYAFDSDQYGVELPVHVITDAKGALNGGVKFAYQSEGEAGGVTLPDDFGVALFLGTTFNIGGKP